MAKLWDKEITVDEQISLLEDFSSYLEVSMLVTIEKFKSIIILQKMGWLNDARDFLTNTLPEVCDEVGQYLVKSKLMNPPNWKIFLKDRLEIAKEAGQAIYSYHEKCFQICASQYQQQYQATYEQELAKQNGLGFGIISSSLAAHLVYAAQSASKERANEKKASEAADRIMHSSLSPVDKAAQMTIAFYHEKFDPFVNDFLIGFYSDIERLIYDGLDVDKETLDNNKVLSGNELSDITEDNHRERITASLSIYPFNSDALFWAVRYDDAGDELIEFCSDNPLLLPKYLVAIEQSAVAYLKKQKEKADLYNRDPLTDEVILLLLRIRAFMTDEKMCGTSIYDSIVQEVYGERIDTVCQKFDTLVKIKKTPLALSNYAKNNKSIYVDNNDFETLVKYNAIFGTSKLKDIFYVIPNTPDDFNKMLLELRQAIQSENEKHQEAERQRKQRERELAEQKRREEEQRKEAERQEELKRQAEKDKQKQLFIQKAKKITIIIAIIAIIISVVAFVIYWCSPASKFEYVEKDDSHINITKVNDRAIKDGTLTIPDKIFGKIVIGIQPNALANTEIVTIIIPASMTEFDVHTFDKCTNLKSIDFKGTVGDWLAITNLHDFDKYNLTHTGECDFSEWFFEEGFDCTQGGTQFKTCNMCEAEESRIVNAGEHTGKTLNALSPTCTQPGLTEGKQCTICKRIFVEQQTISALGHSTVVDYAKSPTCTQSGLTEGTHCSVCNLTLTPQTTVSALGHSYSGWTISESPTCTKQGSNMRVCSICDCKDYSKIDPTGHSYGGWNITKSPTCTASGSKSQICSVCDNINSQTIPANGHSYISGVCSSCSKLKPSEGLTFTAYGNGYLVAGMGSCTDTVLVIPDNHNGSPIIGIADEAFEGNLKITELVLGENVESIGESAFHNCENLSKIVVNAKLKSVSDFAFLNTDMGTIFDVPSASVWASIKFTSHGRPIGFKLYINGVYSSDLVISGERGVINEYTFESYSWVTSVKIEEGITTIEYAAFRDCNNLTELTIPKSVTTIGNRAFNDCWRLKTIYYEGTIAEWKAISEQMHSFTNVHDDCIVICTDGVSDTSYWN